MGIDCHKKVYVLIIQNVGGISSLPIIEKLQSSPIPSGLSVSLTPQVLQFLSKIQNYLPFDLNIEEASKQLQENSRYVLTRKGAFSNRGKLLRMVKGFYNRIQKIG